LEAGAGRLHEALAVFTRTLGVRPTDLLRWAERLGAQFQQCRADLAQFAPWLPALAGWTEDKASAGQAESWTPRLQVVRHLLLKVLCPDEVPPHSEFLLAELPALEGLASASAGGQELAARLHTLAEHVRNSKALDFMARMQALAERANVFAREMDFRLLYNDQRRLFAVGYNLSHRRHDNAHYDLLASEASLTSFLCVARGEVPREHWFQLGRPLARLAGQIG